MNDGIPPTTKYVNGLAGYYYYSQYELPYEYQVLPAVPDYFSIFGNINYSEGLWVDQ